MKPTDVALALLIMLAWGFSFVVIKIGLDNFPPLLFSALRFLIAAIPLVFFLPPPKIAWRVIVGVGVVLGIVKFSLLFIGMNVGLSAGLASLLLQSQAFFTVILAVVLLNEIPTRLQVVGIFIAFLGIAIVTTSVDASTTPLGITLILLAAIVWAVANFMMRKVNPKQTLNLMVWVSLIPPLLLLALSFFIEGPEAVWLAMENINITGVLAILYIAFVGTVLGFAGWGYLLAKYSASQVAPFALLVPIFGMSLSALVLGETFGLSRLLGALLVLIGLAFTIWNYVLRE